MGIVEILYVCYAHCTSTLRQHNNIFLEISDLDTGSNLVYNMNYLKITGTGHDLDLFHAICYVIVLTDPVKMFIYLFSGAKYVLAIKASSKQQREN